MDFEAFVRAMDRCWLERQFEDLREYLAGDMVIRAPNGKHVAGIDVSIESYREFMSRSEVSRFEPRDFVVTQRGETAIVEYGWDMDWTDRGQPHSAQGGEILVIVKSGNAWRVVWRTQLPAG